MTPARADAHVHLFESGYQDSFTARPGVAIDEVACLESIAAEHHVQAALAVGYAGQDWCRDNNRFLADQLVHHDWINALAFVATPAELTVAQLEMWRGQAFVGISIYVFDDFTASLLGQQPSEVWQWLAANRWLISVNSKGKFWDAWLPILEQHETLRVLISHLGLPPAVAGPPSESTAARALAGPLAMASAPGPRAKLSAFYALTNPGHDYPHEAAWPYVECLRAAFGVERLLWGSDYPPHLDWLSYPQTFAMFGKMPFFSADDRAQIEGGNLQDLLANIDRDPPVGAQ